MSHNSHVWCEMLSNMCPYKTIVERLVKLVCELGI